MSAVPGRGAVTCGWHCYRDPVDLLPLHSKGVKAALEERSTR
jgi:hypothetical protein